MNAPVPALALETQEIDISDDPQWYRDAVIYQLNVKAFFDTNDDGVGDFKGVTAKLDYVKDLGVNTIWLMPFYPSPLRDDGYDIAEYEDVHPQYGTLADFKEMMAEAHKRGLRVITELVINHTSDQHPWFQAARNAPPGSPERNFYVWSDTDQIYQGTRIIFTDTEKSNWTWDPVAKQFFWHRFFSHQPDLNFDNPAVMEAVLKTMRFWLDLGVDGFRLDAIPYLIERDGTSNENLPETHAVIKQLRAAIDAEYKNRFLLAEANMWPEDVREYFGDGDECHMAYHFPLMPRMYMAIAQEDRHPIVEIMQQTPEIPDGCQWAIFLRNHDELTLEMVTSKERDYMYTMYAADMRARINLGIRRRLAPLMENDIDRVKLMNGMLLSMPGSPIIYYGDEIGMGDNVFVGDRNGVRTPMQWSPDRNAGFSRADPQRLYLQPIMDAMYGYEALNVEAQARDSSSLLNWTKRMLAVRKTSFAFGRGKRIFLKPGNRKILAYLSIYEDETILHVFNLSRAAQPVELDLSAYKTRVPVEMLGRTSFPPIGELPYMLTLPSFGFYWFRLASDAAMPSWHQEDVALQDRPTLVLFDGWTSFFRERVMPWRMGMADRMRVQFETDTMPRHIEIQRWYATKGTAVTRAKLADYAVWDVPGSGTATGSSWMLPILKLDGPTDDATYFMPLTLAWEDTEEERVTRLTPAALAKIRQQANVGVMADAFYDEPFCRALVQAIEVGKELVTVGGKMKFSATAAFRAANIDVRDMPVSRPSAMSSNTVVTLDDTLFLKGYRRLREGVNPELEMGRFLTDVVHYPNCVPVLGALEYFGSDGRVMTLALVQSHVQNQGDGWDYTLGYLERYLEELRTAGAAAGEPMSTVKAHGGFLALAAMLGKRTAELHLALATRTGDAAFDPEPLAPADVAGYRERAVTESSSTLTLLRERVGQLAAPVQVYAQAFLSRSADLQAQLSAAQGASQPGVKTRYHGDYHLGQVLVTANDFVIIDFEGEPARTFEERRTKGSPLRDVAGMLRSFNYARWSALRRIAQTTDELERLEPAAKAWESATRDAFLEAYVATMSGKGAAPIDTELLRLFEIEKALYELRYELNNRIDWAQVPLQGVLALIDSNAAR